MAVVAKRTIMSLYSNNDDVYSHLVRIVLAEKGVNVEVIDIHHEKPNHDLLHINPYGSIPTLLDRELVLYEAKIIVEYLDERFPHPPLLPVYPVARAEARKMIHRIERDWYQLMYNIKEDKKVEQSRENLLESLLYLEPVFASKSHFLNEEFSLLDCSLAPLLWRLPQLGVGIPEHAKGLCAYMQRIFQRDSFQRSLSDVEKQLRAA